MKIFLMSFLIILGVLGIGASLFLHLPPFGGHPSGARLERVKASPHYRDGAFRNLEPTPQFSEAGGPISAMFDFLFVPHERLKPIQAVPTVKTDLKALPPDGNLLIWLGHSSCFIRLGGRTLLIDPVFSSHASPFVFSTRSFAGSNAYTPDDMPEIDYLILSHDHWDHLDHPTLTALKPKVRTIICGLGVGEHLERWGFPPERVQEADWFDTLKPEQDFSLHVELSSDNKNI